MLRNTPTEVGEGGTGSHAASAWPTQHQLRLFAKPYIPIKPVTVMPREVKAERNRQNRKRNALRREYEATLRALQLPIILPMGGVPVEDRSDIDAITETGPVVDVVAIGPGIDDELVTWSNEGILQLHSVLLEESLKALAAKGNPAEKLDILEWMFEPDYVDQIVFEGPEGPRKTIVYNAEVAFSFAFCCKLEGHDPARYRAFVRKAMPDVVARFCWYAGEDEAWWKYAPLPSGPR